jgi:hypothetical protein
MAMFATSARFTEQGIPAIRDTRRAAERARLCRAAHR